jgi:hypothetical protein
MRPGMWLILISALSLAACDDSGPTPAGTGATILNPKLSIDAGTYTIYCDGTFSGTIPVTATYPAPPPAPEKSTKGETAFSAPQAATTTNIDSVQFDTSMMMPFKANQTQSFSVTGKLVDRCDQGKLAVNGTVTFDSKRTEAVSGNPDIVGPVAMTGAGPSSEPKAAAGAFSFKDTLHCCKKAGTVVLKSMPFKNVLNVTAVADTPPISCPAWPAATTDELVTMAGNLRVPEDQGAADLQVTLGPDTCTVRTAVQP